MKKTYTMADLTRRWLPVITRKGGTLLGVGRQPDLTKGKVKPLRSCRKKRR